MITGNTLWPDTIGGDLILENIDGVPRQIFRGAPSDFYEMLLSTCAKHPDKVFIVNENGRKYTFSDILRLTDDFAGYLYNKIGIRHGAKVSVMLYNGVEFCVAFMAIIKIGAICIPLPTKYRKAEISSMVKRCHPSAVICEEVFSSWFDEYIAAVPNTTVVFSENSINDYGFSGLEPCGMAPYGSHAQDPVIIMYTSGTTSQSKGVIIRNYSAVHAVLCYKRIFSLTEKDSSLISIPIYHVTGLIALFGVFLCCGGTLYLHRYFDAERMLKDTYDGGITFWHASPTVYSLLMQHQAEYPSLPTLRTIACGGGYLLKAKIDQLHNWLPHTAIRTVYGLTETSSPATIFPCDVSSDPHIDSSGIPIPGLSVRITDDDGNELPDRSVGEICMKGTVVLESYFQLNIDKIKDGWLKSGDLGYLDGNYLFVVDRKTDMINRGGEKIWSSDVENELLRIPGIISCAVVGIPDDIYGEVAAALVQLVPGAKLTEDSIRQNLRKRMAQFKVPAKICFTDEIPLTENSKVDKKYIRELLQKNSK